MNPQMLYPILYLELNLMSVVLIAIIRRKTQGLSKMVAQQNFANSIDAEVVFFLSDTYFVLTRSGFLPYSKSALLISKEIYFFSTTLMCFFWFVYFEHMQGSPFVQSRRRVWASSVLVWVMGVLLVLNRFTGILFYVDHQGYHRGPLFLIQYLISYAYVFVTCSRALIGLFQKDRYADRSLLLSLAVFPIAPAAAGILQLVYPQLPVACAVLALCTLILYLNWLDQMISIDPLTKLNNRKQLLHHYQQWARGSGDDTPLYLLMIDANKFKQINDTYGHIQGDAALVRIADALRLSCKDLHRRANIARYGGDEFVILAWAEHPDIIDSLCRRINKTLTHLNRKAQAPYQLTVSIGTAKADSGKSMKELIAEADQRLYSEKKKG